MKTPREELMPPFGPDGHLTEVALMALADGQDVCSETATTHLETCDACSERLVGAALLSVDTGEVLREALEDPRAQPVAPTSAPWPAMGLALAIALAAITPALMRLPTLVLRTAPMLAHAGPVLARGLLAMASAQNHGARLGVTLGSCALLLVFGVTVSRWFRHQGVAS